MSRSLAANIAAARRKHAAVALATGACAGLAMLGWCLALEMLADFVWDFPLVLRALGLVLGLAVVGATVWRLGLRPWRCGPDDDDIALMVERHRPELGTRLIAAVQLSRPSELPAGISTELVGALVEQVEQLVAPLRFPEVIATDRLRRWAAAVVLTAAVGGALFLWTLPGSWQLLQRALLADVPVPRQTGIHISQPEQTVAVGQSVTLAARASGIIPAAGRVELQFDTGRRLALDLSPASAGAAEFRRTVESVQASFAWRALLGDNVSPWCKVTAVPRPAIAAISFTMAYPPYIRRPPESRSPGNLSLLAGSRLTVQMEATKPLRSATLRLLGTDDQRPLRLGPDRSRGTLAIDIPARSLTGLSVHLEDDVGIESDPDTVYPVDIVPDRPPAIHVFAPDRRDITATAQARIEIGFEAADDFGLARVRLWRRLEGSDAPLGGPIELDLTGLPPDDLQHLLRRYDMDLGPLRLPEETIMEYWLEALDANTVTGPGRTSSERSRIKIISRAEKEAELINRLNDQLGDVDSLGNDQEALNQGLVKLILEKP